MVQTMTIAYFKIHPWEVFFNGKTFFTFTGCDCKCFLLAELPYFSVDDETFPLQPADKTYLTYFE